MEGFRGVWILLDFFFVRLKIKDSRIFVLSFPGNEKHFL